jgi:hypothetical protein
MLYLSATPLLLQLFTWEGIGMKKVTTLQQHVKLVASHPGGHVMGLDFGMVAYKDVYADKLRVEIGQDTVNLRGAKVRQAVRGTGFCRFCDSEQHAQCHCSVQISASSV